jgi:hypothetical protein
LRGVIKVEADVVDPERVIESEGGVEAAVIQGM